MSSYCHSLSFLIALRNTFASIPQQTHRMTRKIKVGAVQAEPGWLDLQASVDKTISLIEDAGKQGVNVLGFPEVFIPGYPWSIWHHSPLANTQFIHEYVGNSLTRDSPEMDKIRKAVKAAGLFAVLGYSERDGGSIYIAQVCSPHLMLMIGQSR